MQDDNSKNPGTEQADLSDNRPKSRAGLNGHEKSPGDSDALREQVRVERDPVGELQDKYSELTTALDKLAELKRDADAGAIDPVIFEAECCALAATYEKQGLTLTKVLAAVERLRPPTEGENGLDDAELARLARLKPLAFERHVKAAAQRLGCPVGILRRLVAVARGGDDKSQGRSLELPEIEPWPTPVDGDQLLQAVTAAIRRHVVIGLAEARIVALWTVAAHCFDSFAIFPRLFVTAAEMQCGKTTLLDVLSLLVPRPLAASSTSPAALFRVIAAFRPTMLLDEFDAYLKEIAEELRQIIDAGHKRGGTALRVVGDNHEPRLFDVYAPMVIAAIDKIAATLINRSIIVRLQRRLASEPITPLRLDRAPEMHDLARQIARWAADHAAALAEADPVMGDMINRLADNWRPLFAVADLAGNGWHDLADEAAATVTASGIDTQSLRILLLTDIRAAFAVTKADRLTSAAIVEHLVGLEHRPWPEWGKTRKPISTVQVARLLAPLQIAPGTIRDGSTEKGTGKGYNKTAFRDAFGRYLPAE